MNIAQKAIAVRKVTPMATVRIALPIVSPVFGAEGLKVQGTAQCSGQGSPSFFELGQLAIR